MAFRKATACCESWPKLIRLLNIGYAHNFSASRVEQVEPKESLKKNQIDHPVKKL